jgi:hypothetical protein
LINKRFFKPTAKQKWSEILNESIDFQSIYTSKIKNIKDLTLAEFNFKILQSCTKQQKPSEMEKSRK